ncbi:sensor histidine kinase [Mesorhizobium atlanticum]
MVTEVELLELTAEECAAAGASIEGVPISIRGDGRLLRRLVRNLLDNACRYGGASAIEVSLQPNDNKLVKLLVCDRGPGVPANERERIFEPFYRPAGTRESTGGVGLGLALVRQIARKHGGDVRCIPRHGGGTCFEVTLNVSGEAQPLNPLEAAA